MLTPTDQSPPPPPPSGDADTLLVRLEKSVADLTGLLSAAPDPAGTRLVELVAGIRQLLIDLAPGGTWSSARGNRHDALVRILDHGRTLCGFDCGVIYLADRLHQELICLAEIGLTDPGDRRPPTYKFSETSFVGEVRKSGQWRVSSNPLGDPVVNARGRTYFRFNSELVGVPLKPEGDVLGILVVWGRSQPWLSRMDEGRLRSFADLAAMYLALSIREERFVTTQHALNETLSRAAAESDEIVARQVIMKGVSSFPFDRVRFFNYDRYSRSFVPLDCTGMTDRDRFLQVRVPTGGNPYAHHTTKTFRDKARLYMPQAGQAGSNHLIEPVKTGTPFFRGPVDPDHKALEKSADLPWAVVPLVLGDDLIGQIVVDNADNPQRRITEDGLAYLNTMAALAAGVVASRRGVEFLSYRNLPALYRWLASSHTRPAVIRRLLAFLTCGEALGFSRAVYYEWQENPPRLVYRASVGSLREEDFRHIGEAVRLLSLSDVLRDAPDVLNHQIHDALNVPSSPVMVLKARGATPPDLLRQVSEWALADLSKTSEEWVTILGPLGNGPFWTAPLRVQDRCLGLFLVDRRWQPNPHHRELDKYALGTFAHLAAQALDQYDVRSGKSYEEDEQQLASVAIFIGHEFIEPVNNIDLCMLPLEQAITSGNSATALAKITIVRGILEKLLRSVDQLKPLGAKPCLQPVCLRSLLNEVCEDGSGKLRPEVACPKDLHVMGDDGLLRVCFQELIENSRHALSKCKKPDADHRIRIEVSVPGVMAIPAALDRGQRFALVHFEDTGDGIDPQIEGRIFDFGTSTRSPEERRVGLKGIGLFMIRRIINLHRGMISSCGQHGVGAHFLIFLPLVPKPSRKPDVARDGDDGSYTDAL